jgi:hypothetical protein
VVALGIRHDADAVRAGEVVAVDSGAKVVDAPGRIVALLEARKDRAQDVKLLVERVRTKRPGLD